MALHFASVMLIIANLCQGTWRGQLESRDSIITQQTQAIEQLKGQLAQSEMTINSEIQKLKV